MGDDDARKPLGRRKFLLGSAAGLGVLGATGAGYIASRRRHGASDSVAGQPEAPPFLVPGAKVVERRRLGRTGLDVSVIGIGAPEKASDGVARAVDRGINYIDTSSCYGPSESLIGRALRDSPGLRDRLVIATKWDPGAHTRKAKMLEVLDQSLKRLGVEWIDILQVHWLGGGHNIPDDGFSRLENSDLYAAMDEARKSGKVRFFGATSHDANRAKILRHAIDKGAFDMILCKLNVLDFENAEIPGLLAYAKEKDIGVVTMKSQPWGGAIPKGFEGQKWNIAQANIRWCLQHDIACVVNSGIGNDEAFEDLAVSAVQEKYGAQDRDLLEQYAMALSPDYCRGCGECVPACPEQIAIPYVIQFAMYHEHYDRPEYGRHLYHSLPEPQRWSETCLSCDRCSEACPYELDVPLRVNDARRRLG